MTPEQDLTPEAVKALAKDLGLRMASVGPQATKRLGDQAAATLRALSARVAELEAGLRLIRDQDQGCGGCATPVEIAHATKQIAIALLETDNDG